VEPSTFHGRPPLSETRALFKHRALLTTYSAPNRQTPCSTLKDGTLAPKLSLGNELGGKLLITKKDMRPQYNVPDVSNPECRISGTTGRLVPAVFDLFERFVDQPLVVFLGEIPLDDLGRDHHGEIDRLAPDLLERAARLELNLPLGVGDHLVGLPLGALTDFLTQPLGVATGLLDDRRRFRVRAVQLRGVLLQARFRRVAILLGAGECLVDEFLALLQQPEDRSPGELAEHDDDDHENRERPDRVAEISGERAQRRRVLGRS